MTPSPLLAALALSALACTHRRAHDAETTPPPAAPSVPAAPPAPSVPAAPAAGACRDDAQCVPSVCCSAITEDGCEPRSAEAQGCEAVECPAPVPSGLRCACREGRCVGVR